MAPSSLLLSRPRRARPAITVVAGATLVAALAWGMVSFMTSLSARGLVTAPVGAPPARTLTGHLRTNRPAPDGESLQRIDSGEPDAADGVLPGAVSVFSDAYPGITHLNAQMLAELRRAAQVADQDGVTIDVDSGWRSRAYQEQLFDQAIRQYGSEQAAARWVARPGTSIHEAGDAVDVSGADAQGWLSRAGASFGLCRMYDNEPWHFEWRPAAIADGCPTRYADPTDDPRLGK